MGVLFLYDYAGLRNGTLSNKEMFFGMSGLTEIEFKQKSHSFDKDIIENLF